MFKTNSERHLQTLKLAEEAMKIIDGWEVKGKSFDFDLNTDVVETENEYIIHCEVPGIKKENISIKNENSILKITAKKERLTQSEGVKYTLKEIMYGNFERTIKLSNDLDTENITASLENGILSVKILKKKKKTKEIEIKIQ
jgi:HSP20 family protein